VSHSEPPGETSDQTRIETEGTGEMDAGEMDAGEVDAGEVDAGEEGSGEEGSVPEPGSARQPTGDPAVDEVLGQLDSVTDEPLDTQIEVSEQVQRVLQSRLADLAKE